MKFRLISPIFTPVPSCIILVPTSLVLTSFSTRVHLTQLVLENPMPTLGLVNVTPSTPPPSGHIDSRGIQAIDSLTVAPSIPQGGTLTAGPGYNKATADVSQKTLQSLDKRKQRWSFKRLSFIRQLPAIRSEKVRKLIRSLPSLSALRDGGLLAINSGRTLKTAKTIKRARNKRSEFHMKRKISGRLKEPRTARSSGSDES